MKKLLFSVLVVAAILSFAPRAEAYTTELQSSRTCSAEDYILIATGTNILDRVEIESPTVNSESYYAVFDSTIGRQATFVSGNLGSTVAFVVTNIQVIGSTLASNQVGAPGIVPLPRNPANYEMTIGTNGFVVKKTGNACVTVFWSPADMDDEYTDGRSLGRTPPLYLRPTNRIVGGP